MTTEFGNSGDPADKNSFSQDGNQDQGSQGGESTITPEELAELRKRDVNAQEHIPRLETDNAQLRTELAELKAQVEGSATLQDVLDRIENRSGDGETTIDPTKLAEQVEARLQQKATETTQQENFDKVFGTLKEAHGSDENVDKYVLSKSKELGMNVDEATRLARTSPEAFMKLYAAEGSVAAQQGTASAGGTSGTAGLPTGTEGLRDKAYYDKMMHENPRKYWKPETQAELYRDVYGVQ